MIESENILSLAGYVPTAAEAIDDPAVIGSALARMGTETLVHELLDRGYPREALIAGLAHALHDIADGAADG